MLIKTKHTTDSVSALDLMKLSRLTTCWAAWLVGNLLLMDLAFAQSDGLNVSLQTIEGEPVSAQLISINEDLSLQGSGFPAGLTLAEIVRIDIEPNRESPAAQSSQGIQLHLVNNSVLKIRDPQIESERISFQAAFEVAGLPMELVRGLIFSNSELVEQQFASPSSSEDTVIVQTDAGDRLVSGLIAGIDSQQLEIVFQNQNRKINLERLRAIVMADLGEIKTSRTGSIPTSIELIDGSQINGEFNGWANGVVSIDLLGRAKLELPTDQVRSMRFVSDRLIYLSDLDPISVQQRTLFTLQRPWQRDQSIERNPLTIRHPDSSQVIQCRKGLGTQSFTRLDFSNNGQHQRFLATVGIATETKGRGDCQVQVLGDGAELWASRLRGGDGGEEVDVNIANYRTISLVVDYGESLDLSDHVNWCNARFIK